MTTPANPTAAQRLTDGLLVLIVLSVGSMAGAASFNHVHDWTLDHSPAHTASWLGWANAVITELVPTAALIIIARRRKYSPGSSIAYPMFLLIVAVGVSLTAQLAVAEFSPFGWMVSALPSLAFFGLSKLVFSATKHAHPAATAPVLAPAPVDTARLDALTARIAELESRPAPKVSARKPATPARAKSADNATGKARPAADTTTKAPRTPRKRTNPPVSTPTAPVSEPTPQPETVTVPVTSVNAPTIAETPAAVNTDLLPTARLYADSHHKTHGEPITKGQLATRMRISTTEAERLLRAINNSPDYADTPALAGPHNGSRPLVDVNP